MSISYNDACKFNNIKIHIDDENKSKLYDACTLFHSTEITVKCEYKFYLDILLDNTPLPKSIIELICVWTNDEVVLKVFKLKAEKVLNFETKQQTQINFSDIQFNFIYVIESCVLEKFSLYNMEFCSNIVQYTYISKYDQHIAIKNLYTDTIRTTNGFTNDAADVLMRKDIKYDLWIITCHIIYVLQDTIKKLFKES